MAPDLNRSVYVKKRENQSTIEEKPSSHRRDQFTGTLTREGSEAQRQLTYSAITGITFRKKSKLIINVLARWCNLMSELIFND